jgi:hypothetical protein
MPNGRDSMSQAFGSLETFVLPDWFHSNEVNMKLIGKFVGAFKMIAATEMPWSQTVIPFSFDAENLAPNQSKVFSNLGLCKQRPTATELLH